MKLAPQKKNPEISLPICLDITKPEAEVWKIIDCLLPVAGVVAMLDGGRGNNLYFSNKNEDDLLVVLLLAGKIDFMRIPAGGIIFGTANAPAVLGLQGSLLRRNVFQYVAVGKCDVYVLPRNQAIDLLTEQGLVREVLDYHAYISDMENKYSDRLINKTTYETVSALLLEISVLSDEERLQTSVAQFIRERSNIARSGIMRILADLREGNYLDIQNGKLIRIFKKLPDFY